MSHDQPVITARDHALLSFVVPCEACGAVTERRIGSPGTTLPRSATCSRCGVPQALRFAEHVQGERTLDGCPRCEYHTLCIQKDVNPRLGVAVVLVTYGVILALRLDLVTTLITLAALTLVDLAALRLLVKRVLICYRCKAHYRGFVPGPLCRPFDLATWEAHTPPALLALIALLGPGCAQPSLAAGEEPELSEQAWLVQLDQDLFFPPANEDRDYTQGFAWDLIDVQRDPTAYPTDTWVSTGLHATFDDWARALGLPEGQSRRTVTTKGIGALAYTPDDLEARAPVTNDRPYASLIYYSERRIEEAERGALGSELRIGALGLDLAGEVQTLIHQWNRALGGSSTPVDPEGWDNQISDGGEPTLLYRLSADQVLEAGERHDLTLISDLNLGYQVSAAAGFLWRVGRMHNPSHTTPFSPVDRANFRPGLLPWDCYGWLAGNVRAVGYDALLQGQFRSSEYQVDRDEVSRLVGHAALGWTWGIGKRTDLTYAVHVRSHELDDPGRPHWWGGLTLSGRY